MADDRISETPGRPPRRWDDEEDAAARPPNLRQRGGSGAGWIVAGVLVVGGLLLTSICLASAFFFAAAPVPKGDPPDKGVPVMPPPVVEEPAIQAPAGPRFVFDGMPNGVKGIRFAAKARQVGFRVTDLPGGPQHCFELWNWQNENRLARVNLLDRVGALCEPSPEASRLVVQHEKSKALAIFSLPDGKLVRKDWRPYEVDGVKGVDLAWAAYLDETRLLTIAADGRFDVWDDGLAKPILTVASRRALPRMIVMDTPRNFALSGDRKILATANGDGFEFFDTVTGMEKGKTEVLGPDDRVGNYWAATFNRDGTLLASFNSLAPDQHEFLTIWNVADGSKKSRSKIEKTKWRTGPICWLNNNHLVFWEANFLEGEVFRVSEGRFVCDLQQDKDAVRFAGDNPDGRLWYVALGDFGPPAQMLSVDFPVNEVDRFVQDPNLRARPPLRWQVGVRGIVGDRAN